MTTTPIPTFREPQPGDAIAGSPFFSWAETAVSAQHPHLVRPVPPAFYATVERQVRTVLDPLRWIADRALPVDSWYRTPELNAALTGSATSQHLRAEATDIAPAEHLALFRQMLARRKPLPTGQVIAYPDRGFLHIALPSQRYPRPAFFVHRPARGLEYAPVASLAELDRLLSR